ncbi:MAG TPA: RNA methyltransferase, partial [Bacteroidia bacterium]
MKKELLKYLSGFVTENRKKRFEEVIAHRTRHLTVVLEDIYQPHNAAAVLRSCDCFGIQDVHVIENQNKFEANPDVELGSAKWITLLKHNSKENNTADCIASLKKNGYRIVVTSPHKNDCTIEEL